MSAAIPHVRLQDELDDARQELRLVKRLLRIANERAVQLAGDLAAEVTLRTGLATELAGTEAALRKVSHTADELRYQLRLAARLPGGGSMPPLDGDGDALARTLVDSQPVWTAGGDE